MQQPKVMIGQINTTPRDFAGNVQKILQAIDAAEDNGVDILVFPEAAIGGYLAQDLMYGEEFIRSNRHALKDIEDRTADWI